MVNNYTYYIFWSVEDNCYIATTLEFPMLSGCEDTPEDALKELKIAMEASIEIHKEEGWSLPEPECKSLLEYMEKFLTGA